MLWVNTRRSVLGWRMAHWGFAIFYGFLPAFGQTPSVHPVPSPTIDIVHIYVHMFVWISLLVSRVIFECNHLLCMPISESSSFSLSYGPGAMVSIRGSWYGREWVWDRATDTFAYINMMNMKLQCFPTGLAYWDCARAMGNAAWIPIGGVVWAEKERGRDGQIDFTLHCVYEYFVWIINQIPRWTSYMRSHSVHIPYRLSLWPIWIYFFVSLLLLVLMAMP